MDLQIGRIKAAVEAAGGMLILVADHGNSDEMYERKKDAIVYNENGRPKPKTSHSLNPVPFLLYDPGYNGEYSKDLNSGLGISSVAATCFNLLGFDAPEDYDKSIVNFK